MRGAEPYGEKLPGFELQSEWPLFSMRGYKEGKMEQME